MQREKNRVVNSQIVGIMMCSVDHLTITSADGKLNAAELLGISKRVAEHEDFYEV